jgi:GrpB-like predicted nucleotidyltransferase (UPF0157 family)
MKIDIAPYDPAWARAFADEAVRLQGALEPFEARIEHIGSTSVRGLPAKPIIDILVGLPRAEALDTAALALLPLGYIYVRHYERHMPYRRYLIRVTAPAGSEVPAIIEWEVNKLDGERFPHTHHLHMVALGTEFWERHLLFRDYLRAHEPERDAYAALKQDLAKSDWASGSEYASAKTDFVKAVEAKAFARRIG